MMKTATFGLLPTQALDAVVGAEGNVMRLCRMARQSGLLQCPLRRR